MSRLTAVVLAVLLTTATLSVAVLGGAAAVTDPSEQVSSETAAESNGYAGTHVAFEASGDAVTGYAVDGEEQFERVHVTSQSEHHADAGVDGNVDLAAVANLSGVGLDLEHQSETRAEVATEGSASMTAHDTERGILVVDAGDEAQYVEVALSGESNASAETDGEVVVVESENRTGAFVVVGDGEVTVNEEGNVTADLGSESTLVFRSYDDGERDEEAEQQERLIAEGSATAEVYVDERDGERVADVATYGQDIAVETQSEGEDRVEMTVERAHGEGTIVIATVSEAALEAAGTAEDLAVTVDGEAAAEASSRSELEGAIGGEESAYAVHQTSEASADVLVAINHFSEREVAIQEQSGDGTTDDDGQSDEADGLDADDVPGFGVGVAVIALLTAISLNFRP